MDEVGGAGLFVAHRLSLPLPIGTLWLGGRCETGVIGYYRKRTAGHGIILAARLCQLAGGCTVVGGDCTARRWVCHSGIVTRRSDSIGVGMSSMNCLIIVSSARWSVSLQVDFAMPAFSASSVSEQSRGVS